MNIFKSFSLLSTLFCWVLFLSPLPAQSAATPSCYGDFDMDTDVDGKDLADWLVTVDAPTDRLELFASHFGRNACPSCEQTPVTITYSDSQIEIVNPWENAGVSIEAAEGYVTVTSVADIPGIIYTLSGSTDDGMFKIYSNNDFTLQLNGVNITSSQGPAINIQADETISVELIEGTENQLTDAQEYVEPPDEEDQKGTFFSEGQLIFSGNGVLTINGQGDGEHGLASDDYIEVTGGTVYVTGSDKDGIHTNEGYYQFGGTVDVTGGSDGIDAGDGPVNITDGDLTVYIDDDDRDGIKCDGTLSISGGAVDLTVTGDQSKGLKSDVVELSGGTITINTSGGAALEASGSGYDPSYCTAIKPKQGMLISGAQVTINTAEGTAGRGISSDGYVTISSGTLTITSSNDGATYTNEDGDTDAYHGVCIKADGDMDITGGTVVLQHTGSGGRGISVDGSLTIGSAESTPTLQVSTSGEEIVIGYDDAAEAKAVKADGRITINSGNITIDSADDGIKSEDEVVINAGTIDIENAFEGIEAPYININGGETRIVASDDGLNATMGSDVEGDDGSELNIEGGYIVVTSSSGDGIDSNGTLTISAGTVIVHGPPSNVEVGIDVNGIFLINGGFVVVAQGNSNMVETPSSDATQNSVLLTAGNNNPFRPGDDDPSSDTTDLFHIEDSSGNTIVTFQPENEYASILISSPSLSTGTSYKVYTGGSCTGTEQDGLYTGGSYTSGTLETTFQLNSTVQTVNY